MSIPDITTLFLDLLSPPSTQLASTTPALISYHLSTTPLASPSSVSSLIQHISTSPSLWRGQASRQGSKAGWPDLNWGRAQEVYEAVSNGILYRAGVITTELGTGWRARRRYATFLNAYYAGLEAEEIHPVLRLLLTSASLAALQHVKTRKEKLYVGGSALMGRAEEEVVKAWEQYLAVSPENGFVKWSGSSSEAAEDDMLPPWLACQTFPMMSIDTLQFAPYPAILSVLYHTYSSIFQHGELFASLSADLVDTLSGFHWNIPSPSHTALKSLSESPLFTSLGPLSRAIGRCIEAAGKNGSEEAISSVITSLDGIERLTGRIKQGWEQTKWSDIEDDLDLDEETRKETLPWNALKTLLFSLTLIQSSLLVIITPRPSLKPTELQIEMATQALKTLASTYFVTIKFGPDGFGAWKGVWSGLLEILRADEGNVDSLLKGLEPITIGIKHDRIVERSVATFYLNVAEQVMKQVGAAYIEHSILPCCHPYLEDPQCRDTFESAHSVLLAIFASEKAVANDLAPWYTKLLLQAYPDLMTTSQLRLAFTTMIRCVSNSDDALAWHCILRLVDAIKQIPLSSSQSLTTSGPPPSSASEKEVVPSITPAIESLSISDINHSVNPYVPREYVDEAATTRLDEASSLSPLETQALQLRRGHLLLTLIDQTTSVNLILLRSLLEKIWDFVKEEGNEVDSKALAEVLKGKGTTAENAREALIKIVFNTLGEGLDATKREEGVRWWMERGQELALPVM